MATFGSFTTSPLRTVTVRRIGLSQVAVDRAP
jgi:hypothetical protein